MINLSPPRYIARLMPGFVWNYTSEVKTVYITFDDGPTQEVTPWVLDTLSKHQVKATFFCLGKKVDMHPDIFERIKAEGHTIGNHSYSHLKGWETHTGQYVQDVDLANDLLKTTLFRPPYGRIKSRQAQILRKRYKIVMWSLLSMDYSYWVTPHRCVSIVLNNLKPGDIIVFHDSLKAQRKMKYALVRLIEECKKRGYNFGVIE